MVAEWQWYDWAALVVMAITVGLFLMMVFAPAAASHESTRPVCRECGLATTQLHNGMCLGCWVDHGACLRFCRDCSEAWAPTDSDHNDKCPTCTAREITKHGIPIGNVKGSCVPSCAACREPKA